MNDLIRKAFVMQLNEGCKAEYKKRHDEAWSDLVDVLKSHGGHNYSIFLNETTNQLFGYVEIESEERWQQVANTETCQKWWSYMQDIMATNPDNSPLSTELESVFYLA